MFHLNLMHLFWSNLYLKGEISEFINRQRKRSTNQEKYTLNYAAFPSPSESSNSDKCGRTRLNIVGNKTLSPLSQVGADKCGKQSLNVAWITMTSDTPCVSKGWRLLPALGYLWVNGMVSKKVWGHHHNL